MSLKKLPEIKIETNKTIRHPKYSPTLKVVHGLCVSPSGGTRSLFIAF